MAIAAGASGAPEDVRELHAFVLELGRALSYSGAAVSEIQQRLSSIAAINGVSQARIITLPTALIVSLGRTEAAVVEEIPQVAGMWRLDQISALYELLYAAERGDVAPREGLETLASIREMPPRRGPVVSVLSYTVMTAALCLILQPTPRDLLTATVLGLIVGIFLLVARGRPTLTILVPILSATVVSALTFTAVKHGAADPGLRTLIAPLVLFLPGALLTTATVELASGEMVAGASRLVFGTVQLLLLAFGIIAGAELVGLPSEAVTHDIASNQFGWWAPWVGVLLFGVAVSNYLSAPLRALRWLVLVLLVAWTGQLVGDAFFGAAVSGFVGALVATPLALAIAMIPGGPPSQVTFLPAFWLLVPGAIGLIGVAEVLADPAAAGLEDLVGPLGSIIAIALGVLCGVTLFRGVVATPAVVRSAVGR